MGLWHGVLTVSLCFFAVMVYVYNTDGPTAVLNLLSTLDVLSVSPECDEQDSHH